MIKTKVKKKVITTDWNNLKINDAIKMMEEYIAEATEQLEQVRIVAKEARNVSGIPQNIDMYLLSIIGEIDRIIGGSEWETIGKLSAGVQSIRDSLSVDD